jgi:hypothetical protein
MEIKSELDDRLQKHIKSPKFCQFCGKSFAKIFSLKRHLSLHTLIKPFVCNICSYSFIQKSDLKRHLAVHSNAREFTCEIINDITGKICGKKFRTKRNRHSHVVTFHYPSHEHRCQHCGLSFKYRRTMMMHKRKNHPENYKTNVFICDDCGESFKLKSNLTEHLKRHLMVETESEEEEAEFEYEEVELEEPIGDYKAKYSEAVIVEEDLDEDRKFLQTFLPHMNRMSQIDKQIFMMKAKQIATEVLNEKASINVFYKQYTKEDLEAASKQVKMEI